MCCGGDKTLKASEQVSAAFQNTLVSAFNTSFGVNQGMLNFLNSTLTNAIANPKGFSPAAVTAMRTQARDVNAQQFQNAAVGANTYVASHGGDALPSGVAAQIEGSVAASGAEAGASSQNQITLADEQQRQNNYWNAIKGLTDVAQAENPGQYASNANQAGNTTANLGQAYLASQNADWQHLGGIISGVAGLATSAFGAGGFVPGIMNMFKSAPTSGGIPNAGGGGIPG